MITFKQFLFLEDEDKDLIFQLIEHDCADFLHQSSRTGFLYRGISEDSIVNHQDYTIHDTKHHGGIEMWKKTVKGHGGLPSRRPRDTGARVHDTIDAYFDENFGVYARSKSMFAYANPKLTKDYGKPYIVFPIGKMNVIWSPKIEDLYAHFYDQRGFGDLIRSGDDDKIWDKIKGDLDAGEYREGHLEEAMKTNAELMIQCSAYYAVHAYEAEAMARGLGIGGDHREDAEE